MAIVRRLFERSQSSRKTFGCAFASLSTERRPAVDRAEKAIKVAIVGTPNAGKSTLINKLVDRRVCPASNKVHTTKILTRAICNYDDTQIVFLDTPGIVTRREQKKYQLEKSMEHAEQGLKNADIIGVLQDVSNRFTRNSLHRSILEVLTEHNTIPSFLILNKIDLLKNKSLLLDLIRVLCNNCIAGKPINTNYKITESLQGRGFDRFSDVFMTSALDADGTDTIKKYLIKNAKPGKWLYSENDWTDREPVSLINETIRAKFLDYLSQEIPYKLYTELDFYENTPEKVVCHVITHCPSERIMKLIAGAGNGRLYQITDSAKFDLINMFQKPVSLTITLENNEQNEKL